MAGCGRQFCKVCDKEAIHRDDRKAYESSSAVGQIIGREGPENISVSDLDVVCLKKLKSGKRLLRVIEQKQPSHTLRRPQEQILRLINTLIEYGARHLNLHRKSGVYVLRGRIAGNTNGRRETCFDGPQELERLGNGTKWPINTHEEFFRFLDPEDPKRRKRIGWKNSKKDA